MLVKALQATGVLTSIAGLWVKATELGLGLRLEVTYDRSVLMKSVEDLKPAVVGKPAQVLTGTYIQISGQLVPRKCQMLYRSTQTIVSHFYQHDHHLANRGIMVIMRTKSLELTACLSSWVRALMQPLERIEDSLQHHVVHPLS